MKDLEEFVARGQRALAVVSSLTVSPYAEAWQWIRRNPGTGGARSLAKLLLSLWNDAAAFSFRECICNLDDVRTQLALRLVSHFATRGEDQELVDIGYKVYDAYPRLWELGQACVEAKSELRRKWEMEP